MSLIDYIGTKIRRLKGTVFLSRREPDFKEKFKIGQLFISLGLSHYTPYTIAAHRVIFNEKEKIFYFAENNLWDARVFEANALLMVTGFTENGSPVFLTKLGCYSYGHPSSWNSMIAPNIQSVKSEDEEEIHDIP